MKRMILIFSFIFMMIPLFGQHESLFGRTRVVGAFAAPLVEMGFRNQLNTSVGGGAGLVINSVFIGAYGMGSTNFDRLLNTGEVEQIDIGHGGFWLGFTISPQSLIHIYGSGRIGWGAVNVRLDDPFLRYDDLDKIFVATPEIGLELNITKWLRGFGSIGYRYVDGVSENRGYTNEDFSGTVLGVGVRIGWFGDRRHW